MNNNWKLLTDDDRIEILNSMPDYMDGFCKTWGWLNFSKKTEEKIIEKNSHLITHPVKEPDFTVEKDSQDWKGMDGATAFWLIERHSNHWDDAKLMMEEWLKANSHPVKELTDEEIDNIIDMAPYPRTHAMDRHLIRVALRKAQEK